MTGRRLLRDSRAARPYLIAAGVAGVGTAVAIVAQAALLGHVIASAATHGTPLADLTTPLLVLCGVFAARALLAGSFETIGRLGAARVMSDLRVRLAERLLVRAPVPREDQRTGELAAAAVQGVDALEAYFAGYVPQVLLAALVPVTALAWIVGLDPLAAGILAVTLPLLLVFMILVGKGAQARARSRWRSLALLSGHFLDVVRGLPALRAYRRETVQAETIERISDRYRIETMGTLRVAFLSAFVLELCAMVGTALVAASIGIQLDEGRLSLQAGLTVLLLAPEIYGPLRMVGQQFHASADGTAAAERIYAVLDEELALAMPGEGAVPLPDPRAGEIRFEDVSFAYPGRPVDVLTGFDLELEPGSVTALVGPSGVGKSTVAALLLRLVDPDAGRVICGGVDLRAAAPDEWRRHVAWVPQRTRLFAGTVAENVALADPGTSREAIAAAAHAAQLDSVLAQLPAGLDTRVGEGGRTLSAGQAQRIGLARAFLRDAPLVVLDEPTAHLDAETADAIGTAIEQLMAGRTVLLIAHSIELIERADRVVAMSGADRTVTPPPVTPLEVAA